MPVTLKQRRYDEYDLNMLQTDVASAVQALSQADQPTVKVIQASKSVSLTGSEDFVLVDMSGAQQDVYLLLPAPGSLARALTVKLTKAGKKGLFVKASDAGTVLMNGSSNPIAVTDAVKIVATSTQFFTV